MEARARKFVRLGRIPAAIGAALLSIFVACGAAAQTTLQVERVDDTASQIVQESTETSAGRAAVTLSNKGATAVTVVVGQVLQPDGNQAEVPARWLKLPEASTATTFTLNSQETATFEVRGLLAAPGIYETMLEVRDATSIQRYLFRLTRTAVALPAGFLNEAKPVRIGLSIWSIFRDDAPSVIRLSGRNTQTQPIDLGDPVVGPIVRVEGDARTQPATASLPALINDGCKSQVAAEAMCSLDLALPADLGAGSYTVDVAVTGAGGGQSLQSVPIDIRASAWLAGIIIALGVILGAIVTDWRSRARAVIEARAELAAVRADARRLASKNVHPAVLRRAREMARTLFVYDEQLAAGKIVPAQPATEAARLDLLRRADAVLTAAAEPKGAAAGMYAPLTEALTAALDAQDWPTEPVEAAMRSLSTELSAFQNLLAAAKSFDALEARLSPAMALPQPDDLKSTWDTALQLRKSAFSRVTVATPVEPSAPPETAARAARLEEHTAQLAAKLGTIADAVIAAARSQIETELGKDPLEVSKATLDGLAARLPAIANQTDGDDKLRLATALWDQLQKLLPRLEGMESAAEPETESVPVILSAESELKLDWTLDALLPSAGASVARLRRTITYWNAVTNIIVLLAIAAVGVLILWEPYPAWGTTLDIITAFLAGVGSRLAIGTIARPGTSQ